MNDDDQTPSEVLQNVKTPQRGLGNGRSDANFRKGRKSQGIAVQGSVPANELVIYVRKENVVLTA